ncbi:MAG TPA: hypothetical protein VHQ90_13145 [Thermoanaerobaculia bacterium]|nr:hypothetical protein [Thermoanaerobaculia bacterium]
MNEQVGPGEEAQGQAREGNRRGGGERPLADLRAPRIAEEQSGNQRGDRAPD